MHTAPDAPRAPIPPPLLFAAALLLGIGTHRVVPVAVAPAAALPVVRGVGLVLCLLSGGLAAAAFIVLVRHRTTFRTDRAVSALVTSGPFRISRNPMYLSLVLLVAGVGALVNSAWPLALLVPAVAVVQRLAIVPEERTMVDLFGGAYERYRRTVRRWL